MADKEQWELIELVDEAVASGQITEEMINEYVYEMKVGGRWITDLTSASYSQLALMRGISTEEIIREDLTEGVLYTVTVAQVEPDLDKVHWQRRTGVSFEPFIVSGKFDRFCYQKALTKATRNCIKQLVSATERFDAMKALKEIPLSTRAKQGALPVEVSGVIEETPADMKPVPAADKESDAKAAVKERPDGEPEIATLRKRCFALWTKHNSEVDNPKVKTGDGRLPADFWDRVRAKYGVKSRTTMTLVHWRDCLTFLSDLLNDSLKAEAEAEAKADLENQKTADDAALDEADKKREVEETRKVDDDNVPF